MVSLSLLFDVGGLVMFKKVDIQGGTLPFARLCDRERATGRGLLSLIMVMILSGNVNYQPTGRALLSLIIDDNFVRKCHISNKLNCRALLSLEKVTIL